MAPWVQKLVLLLVLMWVVSDVVALTVAPRRGGSKLVMLLLLVIVVMGLASKLILSGLFLSIFFKIRRKYSSNTLTNTSPSSHASRLAIKTMVIAAESIMRNHQLDSSIERLISLVQVNGLLLVDGLMVSSQLTTKNLLGEGAFGCVYELNLSDVKTPLCIKVRKDTLSDYCFMWEIENLLRVIDLEGVPRVMAVSFVPEGFIMTRHGCRTLENWLKIWEKAKPRKREVAAVLHQLCVILINLHVLKVCHNDLKGDNVMVEFDKTKKKSKRWRSVRITLVDFTILCNYGLYPFGSYPRAMFMSHNDPELMRGERACSEGTDVFSMGYLLRRAVPFLTSHQQEVQECSVIAMGPYHLRPTFTEIEKVLKCALK